MGAELTKAQSGKIATTIEPFATKDEKRNLLVQRYAEKWVRFKTGKRSSRPPVAGLDAKTRAKLSGALDESLSLPEKPRKAKAAA